MNPPVTCMGDAECKAQGATFICTPLTCACMGQKTCAPGCTADGMCGAGEACSASNHCQAKSCVSAADCPTNFACDGAGAPACQRKSCKSDAACKGYCVNGGCYDMPGTCSFPPG